MGTMQRSRVSSTPGGVRPLLQRQFSSLRTYNYRLYFFDGFSGRTRIRGSRADVRRRQERILFN